MKETIGYLTSQEFRQKGMRTYKHVSFIHERSNYNNEIFACSENKNGHGLGIVEWSTTKWKYCFSPFSYTNFDSNYLKDIQKFLDKLNKYHKEKNKEQ